MLNSLSTNVSQFFINVILEIKENYEKLKQNIEDQLLEESNINDLRINHLKDAEKSLENLDIMEEQIDINPNEMKTDIEETKEETKEEAKEEIKEETKEENIKHLESVENTDLKIIMRSKVEERKLEIPEDILEQCISFFSNNENNENIIDEFIKESKLLADICKLKDNDTFEIDFLKEDGKN